MKGEVSLDTWSGMLCGNLSLKKAMSMSKNRKKKQYYMYGYMLLAIVGCVVACSSLISNDYAKLAIVMGLLFGGIYGLMRCLDSEKKEAL